MAKAPRVVIVTRPTDYEALLARHGTREQARFFLESRERSIDEVEVRHRRFEAATRQVSHAIPTPWRRVRISRSDLAQFVFEPEDIVVAIGQDGLVANTAKYLSGQLVIGINPDPGWYDGVLVPHGPSAARRLLDRAATERCVVQERTMVEAILDDGQRLLAVNEIFFGHASHQSARYVVRFGDREERQSSSGIIVSTGTGATGWLRSIHAQLRSSLVLPAPEDPVVSFFVREPFPSVSTGTSLASGLVRADESIELVSEMNDGGTIFGDGIEHDRLRIEWGSVVKIRAARERLRLLRE